jgi:adenosylhomocysteine nucleosidase
MKIVVVTPMLEELTFVQESWQGSGYRCESGRIGRLPVVQTPELGITLARGGTGKAQFALQTQHLIDNGSGWDLVICAGAAGALAESLAIGDVVVGQATVEHDYNNKFNERPLPRYEGSAEAIAIIEKQREAPGRPFAVHIGTIASGDEDVVDLARGRELREQTGALAVAWEGAGGARACHFSGVPFLELRGISDTADHGAAADFEANLELAMGNVTHVVLRAFGWGNERVSG